MDLVNRLKFFLETHQIAISQFADTCRIPRPTLSQILSGRNKKISDELITKIHNAYPELSVLWLMFGEGEMESAANIETSEPQNSTPVPYIQAQESDTQDDATQPDENSLFTYNESEKSREALYDDSAQITTDFNKEQRNEAYSEENSISFFVDYSDRSAENKTPHQEPQNQPSAPPTPQTTNAASAPSPTTSHEAADATSQAASIPLTGGGSISLQSPSGKKISNIVVFYSDNSFQSFSPSV